VCARAKRALSDASAREAVVSVGMMAAEAEEEELEEFEEEGGINAGFDGFREV